MRSRVRLASLTVLGLLITWAVAVPISVAQTFKGPGPWIDVTQYDAKGDGMTDDSAAIQNALDAAAAPVCATVMLTCTPSNTYLVSRTLRVGSS